MFLKTNTDETKEMGWSGPIMGDYMMELIVPISNAMILHSGNYKSENTNSYTNHW